MLRPKTLAQLRMQLKAEREAEGKVLNAGGQSDDVWTGAGPAAKSHLKELTRLMEGARNEAGKNFSQLLQKLDNIKQARSHPLIIILTCCIQLNGFHGLSELSTGLRQAAPSFLSKAGIAPAKDTRRRRGAIVFFHR